MRALAVILWLLAAPLAAEQGPPQTVDEAVARIDQIFTNPATDRPEEEVYAMLGDALRQARRDGRLTRDWAIIYAMLTDGARNTLQNPSYALQLADEGLALIAGDPGQRDYRAILRVTRAYALADLGRLDDAVRAARLALPDYETLWEDDKADELRADVALWADGALTAFNTPATELAQNALDAAQSALDTGAWARAVTLASTALLPDVAGFSMLDRARINARAEYLAARGLAALGRYPEAGNGLLRAFGNMTAEPWQPGQPARFLAGNPPPEEDREQAGQIMLWLANVAARLERFDLSSAALDEAERHASEPSDKTTILTLRASLLWRDEDRQRAIEVLEQSRSAALADNDLSSAAMAGLYLAVARASIARRNGGATDATAISDAVAEAIRHVAPGQHGFIWFEAARSLRGGEDHETYLHFAKQALDAALAERGQSGDSDFGQAVARATVRGTVEEYLFAAHGALSADPGDFRAECPEDTTIYGCTLRQR